MEFFSDLNGLFQTKEGWPGPSGSRNFSSDVRETAIAITPVFIASFHHEDLVIFFSPFSDYPRARAQLADCGLFLWTSVPVEATGQPKQFCTNIRLEPTVSILLDAIGKKGN
jgi:hypothetical protein